MKRSLLFVTIFSLFISLNAWSQVNKGIDQFLLGYYDEAQKTFEQSVSQEPDISYYYLGEIALRKNNPTEAANYYEKGILADGDAVFSRIGKLKLDLKSNPAELKKSLKAITNKNKKKAPVILAAAQAYLDSNLPGEVSGMLSMARSANKSYPYIYIFEGDRLKEKGESGNAAAQYEQAINFDPKSVVAYIKNSMIYESSTPSTAINTLKAGLEANPGNSLIRSFLATNYYKQGFYEQAIGEYEALQGEGELQPEAARNYAASLYFSGKYNEALTALNKIAANEPNHPVVTRLLMYTHDKLKNYDEGIALGKKFFSLPGSGDTFNYLVTDYTAYADALMAKGEIDEAIKAYEKAITFAPEDGTLSKEVASRLASANRTADAAVFYQKYIEAESSEEASDYLQLGLYNYRTATGLSSKAAAAEKSLAAGETVTDVNPVALRDSMTQYIIKADEAFDKVIELAPDSYQGYYWRANVNTLLDPDLSKGLANDYYQKMIDILISNNDTENQSKLVEAYRYFSIYYLYQFDTSKQAADKNKALEYANKVLELKADDETSKKILEALKN